MAKITFKTVKPTGKWKWLDKPSHYIKLDGKQIGMIDDTEGHQIRFMCVKADIMEDGNSNCPWMRKTFAHRSETLDLAKQWFIENFERLSQKYQFYQLED